MAKYDQNRFNGLKTQLKKIEKITLGNYPTPLYNAENLTKRLNGPGFYSKEKICRGLLLEACAYVNCFLEIVEQTQKEGISVNYIFVASEDSTQGGLVFGAEYIKSDINIIGINPT